MTKRFYILLLLGNPLEVAFFFFTCEAAVRFKLVDSQHNLAIPFLSLFRDLLPSAHANSFLDIRAIEIV